jgi:hypothetical protein
MGEPKSRRPGGGAGNEVWQGLLIVALVVLVFVAGYLFVSYLGAG